MREPQVTRTFKTMECNIVAVDKASREVVDITVTVPRIYKEPDKLEKAVEIALGNDMKLVEIVDTTVVRQKYAMPEALFIATATPIDGADDDEENESEDIVDTTVDDEENESEDIGDTTVVRQKYAMPEALFIATAAPIDGADDDEENESEDEE